MLTQIIFYMFSSILVLSATMVISLRDPVHAVLSLILCFFNASALFLIAGSEFLAMLLVIVYVGAVAVLFLFVVMMLDINYVRLREGVQKYALLGILVGGILFIEMITAVTQWHFTTNIHQQTKIKPSLGSTNIDSLGQIIYTHYVFLFQMCGVILLVAMIGAIILTLQTHPLSRRQDIKHQHKRKPQDTLAMMSLGLGKSVHEHGGFLRPKGESYYEVAAKGSWVPNGEGRKRVSQSTAKKREKETDNA